LAEFAMAQKTPHVEKSTPAERRTAERHRCLRECLVRVVGAAEPTDWSGMAYNVSLAGVGLALPFPVPSGSILEIELRAVRRAGKRYRARVARCQLQKIVWFHGCEFADLLNEAELLEWLQEVPAADTTDERAHTHLV
jgi:hypothetical protein